MKSLLFFFLLALPISASQLENRQFSDCVASDVESATQFPLDGRYVAGEK